MTQIRRPDGVSANIAKEPSLRSCNVKTRSKAASTGLAAKLDMRLAEGRRPRHRDIVAIEPGRAAQAPALAVLARRKLRANPRGNRTRKPRHRPRRWPV